MKKKKSRTAKKPVAADAVCSSADFYRIETNQLEVALGWKFEPHEDGFEDVTFLVLNCNDETKGRERVAAFVAMLFKELMDRKNASGE